VPGVVEASMEIFKAGLDSSCEEAWLWSAAGVNALP
jgi:hypothetical protein